MNLFLTNKFYIFFRSLLKYKHSFFFFFIALFYFRYSNYTYWDLFSERDIQRALSWLNGGFYWLGPEMSAGGHLPGPFLYFLLMPALLFSDDIYHSLVLWKQIWLSLTYTIAFHFIDTKTKNKESLIIFLCLFIFSGFSEGGIFTLFGWALNPFFAILFHVLAIVNINLWRETNKHKYLYYTAVVIALGIQTHLLVLLHVITVLFFFFLNRFKNIKTFLLFLLIAFLPIFLSFLIHFDLTQDTSGTTQIKYYDYIKKINRFGSERWLKAFKKFFELGLISFIFLSFSFLLSTKFNFKKLKIEKNTVTLFITTFIPILFLFFSIFKSWYGYPVPLFFILFLSQYFGDLEAKNKTKSIYIGLLFVFLYSYDFNKLLYYNKNNKEFASQFSIHFNGMKASYLTLKPIIRHIYFETGYTPKEAMKHLFQIGVIPEQSLLSHYSYIIEDIRKNKSIELTKKQLKNNKIKGYFMIQHIKEFTSYDKESWTNYLSNSSWLLNVLKDEIRDSKIILKKPVLYKRIWLIPYEVTKHSIFQEGFSNIGQPYYNEEPDWLKNCNQTSQFQKEGNFRYCLIDSKYLVKGGIQVNLNKNNTINIHFFGSLINYLNDESYGDFFYWEDISLNLICKNNVTIYYKLPSLKEFTRKSYKKSPELMGQILRLPLSLTLSLEDSSCRIEKLQKIELNYKQIEFWGNSQENKTIVWDK